MLEQLVSNFYPEEYAKNRVKTTRSFSETYKNLSTQYPMMSAFFITGIFCLLFAGINEIGFNLKYIHSSVSSYAIQKINVHQEPIQIEPSSQKPFQYYGVNKEEYTVIPMADYSISALVVAKNTNVWLRGIMNSDFDNIALMDLGLLCGDVANSEFLHYVRFRSKKNLGSARELRPMPVWGNSWQDVQHYLESKNLSLDYFFTHMSHVHLIPANNNVMSALKSLKYKDAVKLDGYLVDLDHNGPFTKTSLSRSDTNATSRGNGACEVMYVKKVQIETRIYE